MKKARMNISHFRFNLFELEILGEMVTPEEICWSSDKFQPKLRVHKQTFSYRCKSEHSHWLLC